MSPLPQMSPVASAAEPSASNGLLGALRDQFGDGSRYSETLFVLGSAVLLGAALAYHPASRRKAATRSALEQPKTVLLYALVGALVGHIVKLNELMALVVFGIGGLMRFRTDVGEAKDTGRVILSTIVGICIGMNSYLIAVLATLFGWALIWLLERQIIGRVQILGLDTSHMPAASEAYAKLLKDAGCKLVGETRNPKKLSLELVFSARSGFDEARLKTAVDSLPDETRGIPAWEVS